MISFYTMTPVFGLIYALLRRRQTRPFRPIPLWLILVTLAPEVLDGFTHLLSDTLAGDFTTGFRATNAWLAVLTSNAWPAFYAGDHLGTFNWWARLITGLLAAWSIAFALLPFLDGLINEERERIRPLYAEAPRG